MNKLIKACLVVAVFTFVVGCAHKPAPVQQEPTIAAQAKVKHHPSHNCKGKNCADKLGTKATDDTAK